MAQEDLFDCDDDVYNRKFACDMQVDFKTGDEWRTGIVGVALDEMLKVHSFEKGTKSQAHQWASLDKDDVALMSQYTQNDRESMYAFYVELSTFVIKNGK